MRGPGEIGWRQDAGRRSALKIDGFDVRYVSHVCFLFTSPSGVVVVTDPFFAEGFTWQGHFEQYLSRPAIAAGDIPRCDAVFVSHIHGDHFDPDAVAAIVSRTGAKVWTPPDVVEALRTRGLEAESLVALSDGAALQVGDISAAALAGYDNSFDDAGRSNKFSLLMEAGGTRIFYSGDCHEAPPGMAGREVDATFAWSHPDDEKLGRFCRAFGTKQYVLMHGDRFSPGGFFCNFDLEHERRRVQSVLPGVEVVLPERITSVDS